MATLLALLALAALILLWLDGARARELANGLTETLCARRGLQFLDGTVALVRMGLRRTPEGLRIRRMFRFEFSAEGLGRRQGHLLLLGTRLERIDFGLETRPEEGHPPDGPAGEETRVVPFRRRR